MSNRSDVDKKEIQEIMKGTFRDLLDKIVDTEGFVDIERALTILCYRAKYSQKYYNSLKYYNAKVLIKKENINFKTNKVMEFIRFKS